MKTARNDIERNNKQIKLNYDKVWWHGHSRLILKKGDCFLYEETMTDGTKIIQLARCHGQVRPNNEKEWYILAQVADTMMVHTYERWVKPDSVIETLPNAYIRPEIKKFFELREKE